MGDAEPDGRCVEPPDEEIETDFNGIIHITQYTYCLA